ncbi:hypothetical protein H6F51_21490 [Cyanobacteria bacterium FACHB-DQ100]|nr:hypothetical protein [Cyanobacteria bacterium FACHB-DQ100]
MLTKNKNESFLTEFDTRFAQTMVALLLIIGACQVFKTLEAKALAPTSQIPQDRPMITKNRH